jgi:hypothetical protein
MGCFTREAMQGCSTMRDSISAVPKTSGWI